MNLSSAPKAMKFCPFCGGNLEKNSAGAFKFCPFCGEMLATDSSPASIEPPSSPTVSSAATTASPAPSVDYSAYEQIKTMDDIIKNYEQFIRDQTNSGLTDQEIRPLAAELMKRLKSKLPVKPKLHHTHSAVTVPSVSGKQLSETSRQEKLPLSPFCTIVLKSCLRRENLARRLESILLRGYFAIRLAIDTMPCIIVYKGKIASLSSLLPVFREEGAVISLIGGDFESHSSIAKIFASLSLPDQIMTFLQKFPHQLWLGDQPRVAAFTQTMEREGLLVVTDQNTYFLYLAANIPEWFIIPHQTDHQYISDGQSGENILQILLKNPDQTSTVVLKASFPNKADYQKVRQELEMAQSLLSTQAILYNQCLGCGLYLPIDTTVTAWHASCPQCQQTMEQKIIQKY